MISQSLHHTTVTRKLGEQFDNTKDFFKRNVSIHFCILSPYTWACTSGKKNKTLVA